jgi:uncharacterized protein YyaL (SSP411 family)
MAPNRLAAETSPYLRQHATHPVDWYPWGDEPFEVARRTGRPVFLSVGYSTCHWCHVMAEESFEDPEIASVLNEKFVAIKVDREERPDVDAVYMAATQALTGGGGWPMSVWLDHERRPFLAGTYFPPRDGDRGALRGFLSILRDVSEAWEKTPGRVEAVAARLAEAVRMALGSAGERSAAAPGAKVLAAAFRGCCETHDERHGGQAGAPKFPSSFPIRTLLRYHRRARDPKALTMVVKTLEAMAAGGIHDQLAGGFHRYATDEGWRVPHFVARTSRASSERRSTTCSRSWRRPREASTQRPMQTRTERRGATTSGPPPRSVASSAPTRRASRRSMASRRPEIWAVQTSSTCPAPTRSSGKRSPGPARACWRFAAVVLRRIGTRR